MSLRDKWVNALYKAATNKGKIRIFLTLTGLVFFFSLVTLFIVASLWLDKFAGFSKLLSTSWSIIMVGTPKIRHRVLSVVS